ncbi:MAG: bifunctional diguanylate cyclase/phosphodiesterase [Spirochaetaceae bacterium]|nr:bifunctional diguanylate cyclase/phosphodiesterase [Spirochaetaceae bacterium]MDT8297591.1 bifunctional diguanylate cyclase/phosphodiesterase [Spirochaetaceae bacterium]
MSRDSDNECRRLLEMTRSELARERDRADQLQSLIDHDSETGLLRHHILVRRLNRLIHEKRARFAFGIIRLDRNYQRIRHSRDRLKVLLYVTAERIKRVLGPGNLYQSDRSDEFLFFLPDISGEDEIDAAVTDIMDTVREFHNPPASDISFGCNIGVAIFPDHAESVKELEENAEIALGVHEEVRWGGFLYSPEIGATYHENNTLESVLRNGILDGFSGFHVAYQPLVDVNGAILGCEALMRWDAPGHGSISPTRFIPLAEQSGPIVYLGKWILYQVLGQVKIWREQLSETLFASLNMSLVQLEQPDCVEMITVAMNSHKLPGDALQLEVTESALMENPEAVRKNLQAFQKMGIRIMLDDFGTGYSSLAMLNTLPVNTLKIAKEIIDDFPGDPRSVEIVRAIMSISESFGFTTLAEGIEKEEQYRSLVQEGCHILQGFLFSIPLSAKEFQALFRATH